MELGDAVRRIRSIRSELSWRNEDLEELLALAVRRLVNEPFEVIAKGLNPSRFEGWSKGARSKVARDFGSSSDLTAEVLRRASAPERGNLSGTLESAAQVIAAGEPHDAVALEFARAFYDNLANDDGFRIQIFAWIASSNREWLRDDLNSLYESLQERIAYGLSAILDSMGRRPKPGQTVEEHAGMVLALTEGAVMQGSVRGHEMMKERYAAFVLALLENSSEPIPSTA